jgi:hypothetical protein
MNTKTENQDQEIKRLQDGVGPVPERSHRLAAQGRSRFLTLAISLRENQPAPWFQRIFSAGGLNRKEKFAMFATIMIILAFLFGGTGLTAYAAQDSAPGEALYPVRLWTEDVRLALTSDPQAELALLEDYTDARFAELAEMLASGQAVDAAFSSRLLAQIDQMLEISAALSDDVMQDTLEHLRIRLMDQDRISWPVNDSGYGEVLRLREEIATRARLAETGVEDPVQFRLELRNRTRYSQPTEIPPTAPVATPPSYGPGEPGGPVTTPGAPAEPGYGSPTQMSPGPGHMVTPPGSGGGNGSGGGSGGRP